MDLCKIFTVNFQFKKKKKNTFFEATHFHYKPKSGTI